MNIVTGIGVIVLPVAIVSTIQTQRSKKIALASIFSCRVFVIIPTIIQIVYLRQTVDSRDRTHDPWLAVLLSQILNSLSVVVSCVPYLKPFFESLESGLLRADDMRRLSKSKGYGYGYNQSSQTKSKHSQKSQQSHVPSIALGSMGVGGSGVGHARAQAYAGRDDWDAQSQSSQSWIIRETRTWAVTSEAHDDQLEESSMQ